MQREIVTLEIAKELKDKGFREKAYAYYGKNEHCFIVHPAMDMNDTEYRCTAPTISQVLRWLREEHKLFVAINLGFDGYNYAVDRITRILKDGRMEFQSCIACGYKYATYEHCALGAIERILDNLM